MKVEGLVVYTWLISMTAFAHVSMFKLSASQFALNGSMHSGRGLGWQEYGKVITIESLVRLARLTNMIMVVLSTYHIYIYIYI